MSTNNMEYLGAVHKVCQSLSHCHKKKRMKLLRHHNNYWTAYEKWNLNSTRMFTVNKQSSSNKMEHYYHLLLHHMYGT